MKKKKTKERKSEKFYLYFVIERNERFKEKKETQRKAQSICYRAKFRNFIIADRWLVTPIRSCVKWLCLWTRIYTYMYKVGTVRPQRKINITASCGGIKETKRSASRRVFLRYARIAEPYLLYGDRLSKTSSPDLKFVRSVLIWRAGFSFPRVDIWINVGRQ